MFLKMKTRLLFDTPAAGAEGTPPAASMLNGGGGTPPATPPAATPPATPPAGGGANPPATPPAGGQPSWISSLPKEMQENENIKKFTSAEALAGSYLSAVKMIGADKIAVPNKHTTPEEFRAILHKIGLPEKAEDYTGGIKFKDTIKEETFKKAFAEEAFKHGILPAQAQAMADFYADQAATTMDKVMGARKAKFDSEVADLQKEWGGAFNENIAKANKVIADLGGEGFADHFNNSGYGGDKQLIKFLAKVGGEMFKEHNFVNGSGGGGGLSPQELDKKIAEGQANPAYTDKLHPQHKLVVAEVKSLFEQKYPVDKK